MHGALATCIALCRIRYLLLTQWVSQVAQMVKCLPALRETRVRSLAQENPLEKEMVTHSSTLATSCEELTHWKRPWCREWLKAEGEGDDRGWDGWMASPTRWMWVWVDSGCWWWTGRPGVLWFIGSQRVGHDWATELNSSTLYWAPTLSHVLS